MRFRKTSRGETKVVLRAGKEFGGDFKEIKEIFRDKVMVVSIGGRKEVFITTSTVYDVLEKMKMNPYFLGLYIGELKGKRFLLGLEGGSLLAPISTKKVIVGEAVEQLVLYGRDVFINSIHEAYPGMKKGDRCLILNRRGEFLAVGRVEEKIIKNLLDRGWYLRKGE